MRGLVVFGLLVSTVVVCVLSDTDQPSQSQTPEDASALAPTSDQLTHGHRSKRSPYHPIVPALVVGKSFLLGAIVGKSLRRGWGWRRPRHHGWGRGWGHHSHSHSPVVVSHTHSHGGWGGWQEEPVIVSQGWGWSS